jgi:hypothetical protein
MSENMICEAFFQLQSFLMEAKNKGILVEVAAHIEKYIVNLNIGVMHMVNNQQYGQCLEIPKMPRLAPTSYYILPSYTIIEYEETGKVKHKQIIPASQKEYVPAWLKEMIDAKCIICKEAKRKYKLQLDCNCYADEECVAKTMKFQLACDILCPMHPQCKIDKNLVPIVCICQEFPNKKATKL